MNWRDLLMLFAFGSFGFAFLSLMGAVCGMPRPL